MLYSRNTCAMVNSIFILMILLSSLGVDGTSYTKGDQDLQFGNMYSDHRNWQVKRMNQISCHCCSNSFNSRCCLQCMQRVGKRSYDVNSVSSPTIENVQDSILVKHILLEKSLLKDDLADGTSRSMACSCCLLQMSRQPFSGQWSCCNKCSNQLKSTSNSDMDLKHVV